MLYHLHEWQRASLAPLRLAAEANMHLFRHPLNPAAHTHGGRAIAAACELFEAAVRPHGKPRFAIHQVPIEGREVAVHERVVHRKPFCQIKHFERETARDDPKLLIVAPLSGHFATLLRGTVRALAADHDVYITDWRDARQVPLSRGPFHLDDYVDYLIEFMRLLGPDLHVVAVCQPSVPALAAAALLAEDGDAALPRTLTLMGGPIDTRINPTVPNKLASSRPLSWFERHAIQHVPFGYPGAMRRVYPGFLQLTGFMSMNLERHLDAHLKLFQHLVEGDGESAAAHRAFYDEYRAVMDMPADYYLETVGRVFQEHDLPRGRFRHRGRPVRPERIRDMGLMTVEGEKDDISGPGQTEAAHRLCPAIPRSRRQHYLQAGVGHYGVFNGRRWREEIAPRIGAFIRRNGAR